jgi:PAS domain S-box-containing protein
MATTQAGVVLGTAAYMAPEQARGRPVDRRADIWAFGPFVERVLTGQKVEYTTEVHFLGPGRCWIHAVYVPTYSEQSTVDGWIAVVTDVTEERRTTERIRDQAQLLDLTQDAVLSMRWDGVIEFWNRGAEARYGWSREEAIGRVAHDLLHTEFPESLPEIQRTLVRDGYWQGELIHAKRDGSKITVASRWAVRRDLEDRLCGSLEITTDITERKLAESLGYPLAYLQQAGVVTPEGLDTLAHRIVFPLEGNLYGRSIGNAAPHRFLPGGKGGLYGWEKVRAYPEIILVEGLFDLAVLRQAGFPNVTCSIGTYLNATQMQQLCGDAARKVYVAFDSDRNGSGQRAARQLAQRLRAHRVEAFPVQLPDGHDPNSFFVHGGGDAHQFQTLLERSRP